MKQIYAGDTPPGMSGGGGVSQGPGTAIADNKIVRGDTAGIQGSLATLDDAGTVTSNGLMVYPAGNQSADGKIVLSATNVLLASDMPIRFYTDTDIFSGSPDSGIVRSGAGTLKVTNGGSGNGALMIGGAVCRGFTSSAGAATTTQYPNDKDFGLHKNTSSGVVHLAFNDGGIIKSVQLA